MAGPLPWQRRLLVQRLSAGQSQGAVAAACGVHQTTVGRWLACDQALGEAIAAAARSSTPCADRADLLAWLTARDRSWDALFAHRPHVPWRHDCPTCGADIVVRTAVRHLRYWRCSQCTWASWRPPAPGVCPQCRAAWYWSHSRKTVGCASCGYRARAAS